MRGADRIARQILDTQTLRRPRAFLAELFTLLRGQRGEKIVEGGDEAFGLGGCESAKDVIVFSTFRYAEGAAKSSSSQSMWSRMSVTPWWWRNVSAT